MLFDLRGRGRRRTVQVIYASLALLMGGGLVLFGIGGATSGGLFDAIGGGSGGSGDPNSAYKKRIERAETASRTRPSDPAPWAELARAHVQAAGTKTDANGTPTADGRQELVLATRSWERYSKLKPTGGDATLAPQMVRAYTALGQFSKAVDVQELVLADQGASTGQYSTYAQLAYAAGQTRKADLAAAKAVSLAPKDQREQVKAALAEVKKDPTGSGSSGAATG